MGEPLTPSEITLQDLLALVWKQKLKPVGAVLLGLVVGGGVSWLLPKQYESHASFVGTGGSSLRLPANLSALGNLAGQLGLGSLAGGDATPFSPSFFSDLLTADTILTQLAEVRIRSSADTELYRLVGVGGKSRADSLDRAIQKLRRMIVVDLQSRTGVITFSLTAKSASVASEAADTLLELLNAFIARDLRTRAGAQRVFLEKRIADVARDLHAQQDQLQKFLETNRDYRNSPELQFRQAELQRELDLKRDVYLSVSRSLEEARMNEVRDTPILSIIDRPSMPLRPTSPKPLVNAVLLALFMPVFWLALVLVGPSVGRRTGPPSTG